MSRVGILGGGISGIALAAQLGPEAAVLEKDARIGGLCRTVQEQGFTYDACGPHILFSRNKDVLALMLAALGDNVHQRRRENRILYDGRLVKYPFENDLFALAPEDNFECILGYLRNPRANDVPQNLADWSYVTFGAGISDKYLIPYNRKIWNCPPETMGLDIVPRIPKPPLEDVLRSSLGIPTEGYLHQLYFHYPKVGGYEQVVHAFARRVQGSIETGWEVARIDGGRDGWRVTRANGEERRFETLVSTLPVHELLKRWPGAPAAARAAAERLRVNALVNVVIGMSNDPGLPYSAIYLPDPRILFHRVSFPKAFSEHNVPEGSWSVLAEITVTEGDAVWQRPDEDIADEVVRDLARLGLCDPATVTYRRVFRVAYGYPIPDLGYRANVTTLREAIEGTGLRLLGRFGQFEYINSDVCVERAIALARELEG